MNDFCFLVKRMCMISAKNNPLLAVQAILQFSGHELNPQITVFIMQISGIGILKPK